MKVLVTVKRVPDGNVPVRLKPDASGIELAGMPMCINPFDEAALEKAIQLKEAGLASEIIAVSIGNTGCQETLRHALALGADRAIRIDDDSEPEPLGIARLLRTVVERESPALVMLGKQASDSGCGQVGPMLAALLGWPQGDSVSAMRIENDLALVSREIEGGQEQLALPLPAVISADLRLATPRYLKLPQLLQAKKKPIETLIPADPNPAGIRSIETLRVAPPAPRNPARRTRNTAELLGWLRDEGLFGEAATAPSARFSSPAHGHALVLAEHDGKCLHPCVARMISAASQLGAEVSVLGAGSETSEVATQAASLAGVSRVWSADGKRLAHQPAEDLAQIIADCVHEHAITAVLAAATPFGKAVLPRAAGLLETAMCSDVVAIVAPDTFIYPVHAGEALVTCRNHADIRILTLRPSAFARAGEQTPAPILAIPALPAVSPARWLGITRPDSQRPKLGEARVIVSGGSGLQSAGKFRALLEPLADRLGAAIGATLSAVDSGFIDNDHQIGQTGATVAPEFYFAVGMSGAAQHLAGMRDSRVIVALNKDPEAPICRHANYVLEGDLFEKVPELLDLLG